MKKGTVLYFLIIAMLAGCGPGEDESLAIKKVLQKESATWRARDAKGHAACWLVRPYSRILVSTADGRTFDVPPSSKMAPIPAQMGDGGVSVNSNYKMSINGTTAWVSHDEESTAKDGRKSYSYEIRMLEKVDGQWKLVGQSIHLYDPK